jgi:hypothetical protein
MTQALIPNPNEVAAARLAQLDLTAPELLLAVRAGIGARRTATLNHPPSHGGQMDYGERIATLRETLVPKGWTRRNDRNMCFVDHPDRMLTVMTALGSAGTGTADPVTTQRSRGEVTRKVVRENAQLELDLQLDGLMPAPVVDESIPTWVLLVHPTDDEVRSELSKPWHISEEGYIDTWVERIPLPVVQVNLLTDGSGEEEGRNHDFDVPER